jgi:hypothetical protein
MARKTDPRYIDRCFSAVVQGQLIIVAAMKQGIRLAMIASAALIAVAPASAAFRPIEMSIPFVSHGGIRDWRAIDRDTLYVQDNHGYWYRAELMTSCLDLPFTETIGFAAGGTDRFDRFSSVIVRGRLCPLKSFVASGPPPKKEDLKALQGL